ncbi:hypothetical protein [Mucilaginibacter gynuensis]|uniref:hypothetical protein n=1 Tax=Mucilaginibacter gynuensis TaxID=1302236 RepID=UPI0031E5AF28
MAHNYLVKNAAKYGRTYYGAQGIAGIYPNRAALQTGVMKLYHNARLSIRKHAGFMVMSKRHHCLLLVISEYSVYSFIKITTWFTRLKIDKIRYEI